jgi:hypothetical protein
MILFYVCETVQIILILFAIYCLTDFHNCQSGEMIEKSMYGNMYIWIIFSLVCWVVVLFIILYLYEQWKQNMQIPQPVMASIVILMLMLFITFNGMYYVGLVYIIMMPLIFKCNKYAGIYIIIVMSLLTTIFVYSIFRCLYMFICSYIEVHDNHADQTELNIV